MARIRVNGSLEWALVSKSYICGYLQEKLRQLQIDYSVRRKIFRSELLVIIEYMWKYGKITYSTNDNCLSKSYASNINFNWGLQCGIIKR